MSIFLLRYSIWTAVTDYRKHLWRDILVDVWPLVLSPPVLCLNLAKSATLCSFVQSEGADKTAVYPIFAGEQRKEINKWDNLQLCPDAGKAVVSFNSTSNKETWISSSCLVPLQNVNVTNIEWPRGTMKDQERPWMIVNGHEWPWMTVNDYDKLATYHPLTSHTSP